MHDTTYQRPGVVVHVWYRSGSMSHPAADTPTCGHCANDGILAARAVLDNLAFEFQMAREFPGYEPTMPDLVPWEGPCL